MRASKFKGSLHTVGVTLVSADARNNISAPSDQEEPGVEPVFLNGPRHTATAIPRYDGELTPLSDNKRDTAIVIATSATHNSLKSDSTKHKRSDSSSKPKKKKPPKNKSNKTNSTEEEDDDDSGVGRGITLPISLAISLVLLVGGLQI